MNKNIEEFGLFENRNDEIFNKGLAKEILEMILELDVELYYSFIDDHVLNISESYYKNLYKMFSLDNISLMNFSNQSSLNENLT